jgi:hypothetical protein
MVFLHELLVEHALNSSHKLFRSISPSAFAVDILPKDVGAFRTPNSFTVSADGVVSVGQFQQVMLHFSEKEFTGADTVENVTHSPIR